MSCNNIMPKYYFHFHVPDEDIYFNGQLQSVHCIQIKKNGQQCKNHCIIGTPYCRAHLLYQHFLVIKTSTIPNAGLGVFVKNIHKGNNEVVFKTGDRICAYDGEVITQEVADHRYGNNTAVYGVSLHNHMVEDGALRRGIGSLINHKPSHANCRLSINAHNRCQIIATKNIRNNTELFLSYGRSYKLNEPNVHTATNHFKWA